MSKQYLEINKHMPEQYLEINRSIFKQLRWLSFQRRDQNYEINKIKNIACFIYYMSYMPKAH
jgi:hypothetical protein